MLHFSGCLDRPGRLCSNPQSCSSFVTLYGLFILLLSHALFSDYRQYHAGELYSWASFFCKSYCNLTTMSFSTPPCHSVPQWFLVQRTDRNYVPYIPPSPFSSDSDTEPKSPTDNQGLDCSLDLEMSQVQSLCMEELELPEPVVSFYMHHKNATINWLFTQQYSPTRSTSLPSEVFNTCTWLTPTHSQISTQGAIALAEVGIPHFCHWIFPESLMIYFRM